MKNFSKTGKSHFYCFLVLLLAFLLVLPGSFISAKSKNSSNNSNSYTDVAILSTTDMHGKCWETNILYGTAEPHNMLRVSTAVKEIRSEYGEENVILIDNGDLFQGTLVSQTQILEHTKGLSNEPFAMAVALKEIGYDAFVLGNHEFNYNWNSMKVCYDWLTENGVKVLAANVNYNGSDGINKSGKCVVEPYMIKTIIVNGHEHKVGILGLENCDVTRWDLPLNYPGISFVHKKNTKYSMAYEARKYINKLKKKGCEFIVVSYHGAIGDTNTKLEFGVNSESQGKRILKGNQDISLLITGHDHISSYSNSYYKDKNGNDVLVVNGGGQEVTKSVFRFSEDSNGNLTWIIIESENLSLDTFAKDEALEEKIRPYAELAEAEAEKPVGTLLGDWDKPLDYYVVQTNSGDLVNAAIMDICTDMIAEKYDKSAAKALKKSTGLNHLDVDLAINSPSTSTYTLYPGDISAKDIYKLYKYSNNIYCIPMYGSDIKNIIEENASERLAVRVFGGEPHYYSINDNFTHLSFGGLNFEYDMSKPEGERVIIHGFSNGRKFKDGKVYLVAVNNYVLGNERCGLRKFSSDDAIWSQTEDANGELVQDIIEKYIRKYTEKNGGITTDLFTWKWGIIYSADPGAMPEYEGNVFAEYSEELQDGHKYIIYHEGTGSTMTNDGADASLGSVAVKAYGEYLVDEKPEEAIVLTAHFNKEGYVSFEDENGDYLSCGKTGGLSFIPRPEEGLVWWKIEKTVSGSFIINTEAENNQALQVYSGKFMTYRMSKNGYFIFNFYEVTDSSRRG